MHRHTLTLTYTTLRQLLHLELTDVQGNSSELPVQLRPGRRERDYFQRGSGKLREHIPGCGV